MILPGVCRFLAEHSQQKVAILVRLERRRYDAIVPGRQLVTSADFAHVAERRRLGGGAVVLEELDVQRLVTWLWQLLNNNSITDDVIQYRIWAGFTFCTLKYAA